MPLTYQFTYRTPIKGRIEKEEDVVAVLNDLQECLQEFDPALEISLSKVSAISKRNTYTIKSGLLKGFRIDIEDANSCLSQYNLVANLKGCGNCKYLEDVAPPIDWFANRGSNPGAKYCGKFEDVKVVDGVSDTEEFPSSHRDYMRVYFASKRIKKHNKKGCKDREPTFPKSLRSILRTQ